MYVFVLQTHTAAAHCVFLFRTLNGAFAYLQTGMPFELVTVPYSVAANDLAERKSLHDNKPYKLAWTTDKSWYATVTRQEILEDDVTPVSSLQHSFHIHSGDLFTD